MIDPLDASVAHCKTTCVAAVGVKRYGEFSVNTDWYTSPCAQAQVRASDTADKVMIFLETL